jgi:hypothetical protein
MSRFLMTLLLTFMVAWTSAGHAQEGAINSDLVEAAAELDGVEIAEPVVEIDGEINTDEEAATVTVATIEAFKNGTWALSVSGLLSLLVWLLRKKTLSGVREPYATALSLTIGTIGGTAVSLAMMNDVSVESVVFVIVQALIAACAVTFAGNVTRGVPSV